MESTTIQFVGVVDVVNDVVIGFLKEEFMVKLHETLDNFVIDDDGDDDVDDGDAVVCAGGSDGIISIQPSQPPPPLPPAIPAVVVRKVCVAGGDDAAGIC